MRMKMIDSQRGQGVAQRDTENKEKSANCKLKNLD
jgi:hypothetical protein